MNFQCKNCGGNMVFDPEKQQMLCLYCDSIDSEEKKGDESVTVCASCGGTLEIDELTSSSKCPYCGNYLVFDERVSGTYKPDRILPFKVSKKAAVEFMEKEFKKRRFAPSSFLSEKTLVDMNGYYVPFFMYDYHTNTGYVAEATKTRHWTSGNYSYTETSHYNVERNFTADYDNVPVDASVAMPDMTMDLMEPYDYQLLTDFDPKFMSGFFSEIYNQSAEELAPRADSKVKESVSAILKDTLKGYESVHTTYDKTDVSRGSVEFSLLPVWLYSYQYGGKTYPFYVNGQSGKVVGVTPVSKIKVFAYSITFSGLLFGIIEFASSLFFGGNW